MYPADSYVPIKIGEEQLYMFERDITYIAMGESFLKKDECRALKG